MIDYTNPPAVVSDFDLWSRDQIAVRYEPTAEELAEMELAEVKSHPLVKALLDAARAALPAIGSQGEYSDLSDAIAALSESDAVQAIPVPHEKAPW